MCASFFSLKRPSSKRICATGSLRPANITPTQSMKPRFAVSTAFSGTSLSEETNSASCCVSPLMSVAPWHAEHVLADVGEHQVGRDRRDPLDARLAPAPLHMVLARHAEAAVGLHAGLRRLP